MSKASGMQQAISSANQQTPNWDQLAESYFTQFLAQVSGAFATEDVREWAANRGCPEPPSLRAWGPITLRIAKQGLITKVGYTQVKNPTAHQANAALWRKI